MLQLFDFADPPAAWIREVNTNVPLQGLFFLNSDLVMNQADLVAKRLPQAAATIRSEFRMHTGCFSVGRRRIRKCGWALSF